MVEWVQNMPPQSRCSVRGETPRSSTLARRCVTRRSDRPARARLRCCPARAVGRRLASNARSLPCESGRGRCPPPPPLINPTLSRRYCLAPIGWIGKFKSAHHEEGGGSCDRTACQSLSLGSSEGFRHDALGFRHDALRWTAWEFGGRFHPLAWTAPRTTLSFSRAGLAALSFAPRGWSAVWGGGRWRTDARHGRPAFLQFGPLPVCPLYGNTPRTQDLHPCATSGQMF